MRVLILALSVLGILVSANAAKAGLSANNRELSASVDPATSADPTATGNPATSAVPAASADPAASVDPATSAGPTASVDPVTSANPAVSTDEATQRTEDQIGLDREKRRDVQRWLTNLGFDTRVNGKFDASTRAVITRWQAARGYPKTGFLNTLQHQALLAEVVSKAQADAGSVNAEDTRPAHRPGGARHRRGGGGPGGLIGGVVGGLFGR
jgi:hypothetical protein